MNEQDMKDEFEAKDKIKETIKNSMENMSHEERVEHLLLLAVGELISIRIGLV